MSLECVDAILMQSELKKSRREVRYLQCYAAFRDMAGDSFFISPSEQQKWVRSIPV